MTCINIKHYQKVKDLIHPNITDNIDYYRNLYILLAYDGCGLRNRNGFHKRIDYSRGHQCVLQTSKPDWRRTKRKKTKYKEFISQDIKRSIIIDI